MIPSFDSLKSQLTFQVPIRKIRRFVSQQKLDGYVETSARQGGPEVDRVFHEAIRYCY